MVKAVEAISKDWIIGTQTPKILIFGVQKPNLETMGVFGDRG